MITGHWRAIARPHTSPLTAPRFPPQLWMGVISDSLLSAEAAPMLSSVCFVVSGTDDRSFLYSVPFNLQSNIQFLKFGALKECLSTKKKLISNEILVN